MKLYKVLDLSYSDDLAQHLKEVRAYHEGDGWHLLTVVYAAGRWLYYLEREAAAGPRPADDRAEVEHLARRLDGLLGPPRQTRVGGVTARASGGEQGLAALVRRVGAGPSRAIRSEGDARPRLVASYRN
ncbi:MAG TPA: hypothetical protein VN282_13495 [Pyrinomonadaceae bacterium]|nr:hypothetical protein [Pyrinomonadaceae bacterium]